jgi:hypothetical protein
VSVSGAPERDGYAYPLRRRNDRELAGDWRGPIFIWDIDNTYLQTEWDSLGDLIKIRLETAEDKRPVPGAVELLAGLRRVDHSGERAPFYFVSASPNTMRNVLEKRMLLDGVMHDGITFRDLRKLRYLRDIFGYKVAALLLYRLENPVGGREVLFGDDREHDPLVYTVYSRICSGELRGDVLYEELTHHGVRRSARRYIRALADELPAQDPVSWAVIRRLRPSEGPAPEAPDPRLVFVDDYAQAGVMLAALQLIAINDLRTVVQAVRGKGLGDDPLGVVERCGGSLPQDALAQIREALQGLGDAS